MQSGKIKFTSFFHIRSVIFLENFWLTHASVLGLFRDNYSVEAYSELLDLNPVVSISLSNDYTVWLPQREVEKNGVEWREQFV